MYEDYNLERSLYLKEGSPLSGTSVCLITLLHGLVQIREGTLSAGGDAKIQDLHPLFR